MSKKVKMVLHGEPGVGKSTFASKAPNPLFLCSDGNFEWLNLPDENHINLTTYAQAKQVFNDIVTGKYPQFDTIVVDLVEDLYMWATQEFCIKNKVEHIGDYGSYGKGYDVVRKEFLTEISKLIAVDKNIIFLSHSVVKVEKDRRGTESHKYYPSDIMSLEKLWMPIEGKVRYFLRAYMKPEEINGKIVKKRYLSINPKENEFGIARGLDESMVPEDIELDWNLFSEVVGLDSYVEPVRPTVQTTVVTPKPVVTPTPVPTPVPAQVQEPVQEPKVEPRLETPTNGPVVQPIEQPIVQPQPVVQQPVQPQVQSAPVRPTPAQVVTPTPAPVQPTPVPTQAAPVSGQAKPMTQAEKIAAIKAKFANKQ